MCINLSYFHHVGLANMSLADQGLKTVSYSLILSCTVGIRNVSLCATGSL